MNWNEQHSALALIFGGLSFFMYGMHLASDQLQRLSRNKIEKLFRLISGKNYIAIVVGIVVTVLMQSSGAVTSMLVGLGSAEVITLRSVMGLIVGTAIGTTFIVQIMSFDIAQYGLPLFIISYVFYFASKKRIYKNIAGVFVGFGLLFFGLHMMGQGADVVKQYNFLKETFEHLKENPFILMIVTAFLAGLLQGSVAIIGFIMSLAASQIIPFHTSLYMLYGANIGTTATALIASLQSNYVGKQVAWAHFFYKIIPFMLYYFLTDLVIYPLWPQTSSVSHDIANAHTVLNIISAIMFYPFIGWGAQFIEKMFPRSSQDKIFAPEYLALNTYQHVELAFAQARREALRMGDIVMSMIKDSINLFERDDQDLIDSIRERDNQVDLLQREIKLFLAKIDDPGDIGRQTITLINYVSDLEGAGDVIDNGIMELARKKHALKIEFSEEGWNEIRTMHNAVMEIASLSLTSFQLRDKELANRVITKKRESRVLERQLKESHIERLKKGLKESINTSSIHMDLLSDLRRITGLLANHAYSIADQSNFGGK